MGSFEPWPLKRRRLFMKGGKAVPAEVLVTPASQLVLDPRMSNLWQRRAASNPAFGAKLAEMGTTLSPILHIATGEVHPRFPKTMLHFWLLVDEELEDLAHFYHQRTPSEHTAHYPCVVAWHSDFPLEHKRRMFGRFIGLRGCESPWDEETISANARRAARTDEAWNRKFAP